ncbi:sporulation histidine kinase inhibitor Sda [Paenibacillus gansuensis]|uniref:Sporulation histidine kinase inhibitor Sda n=1 Tax=Paenibacillus gansuensis TaxID=306542 RepID=A0ABW5PHA9_9BACL
MNVISNEVLVESYFKAVDLDLEDEFIYLLLAEIHKRNLNIEQTAHAAGA